MLITSKKEYLYSTIYTKIGFLKFVKDNNLYGKNIYCDLIDNKRINTIYIGRSLFHGKLNIEEFKIEFDSTNGEKTFYLFNNRYDFLQIFSVNPLMICSNTVNFLLYLGE